MRRNELINEWLIRAKSNLLISKLSDNNEIFFEDLCFNAQQCVEKSLKALCIYYDIPFPKTHSISYLIELLGKKELRLPDEINQSASLTDYSVEARYPGDYDEVDEKEYYRVVKIAEKVYNWVTDQIE